MAKLLRDTGGLLITENPTVINKINAAFSMEPQRLFIVAGMMDLTSFIEVPSYQVNLREGYNGWTDSNFTEHRDKAYEKVAGSFRIRFETVDQFQAFMVVMDNNKNDDGSIDCTVFLNNKLTTITTALFVDFEAANIMPLIETGQFDGIDITVVQRGNNYVRS